MKSKICRTDQLSMGFTGLHHMLVLDTPTASPRPGLQRHADGGLRWIGTYQMKKGERLVVKDTGRISGKRLFQCTGCGASPVHDPDSM